MKWLGTMLVFLFTLTGCGLNPWQESQPKRQPFPEDVYKTLPKTGDSSLSGVVMVSTQEGEVHYGNRVEVVAAPATSYSQEAYDALSQGQPVPSADPRAQAYTRHAQTDKQGFFRMMYMPAGRYFVISQVRWKDEQGEQHQVVRDEVTLKPRETTYINLMNP